MTGDRETRIRERAHAIWEREGRPHGRHEEHWSQASQEVGEELFQVNGAAEAQERRGALGGGLLPEGALVAAGGPGGVGIGGLGVAGKPTDDEDPDGPGRD